MYNCKKARLTQQYKDAICESSDREYMRRMYYDCASKMSTGVSESIQRIRYLTSMYHLIQDAYLVKMR